MLLPLYVHETPFKEMIGDCIENQLPFGLVLKAGGIQYEVGCSAVVAKVLTRHEDGRMQILAEGDRRIRLLGRESDTPYPKFRVQFLPEPKDPARDRAVQSKVREIIELYKEGVWILKPKYLFHIKAASRQEDFSFSLAHFTIPHLTIRQSILEMPGEAERLDLVIRYYKDILPELKPLGGNGGRPTFVSP
jgi:hypothetical protein